MISSATPTRTGLAAGVAGAVLGGFVLFLLLEGPSDRTVLIVNNLVQTVSALVAGVVCAAVAKWGHSGRSRGWAAMAVALIGWGAGQAYWSWSEIVANRETPFPSPADIGFLVFPVASALAVLWHLRGTQASRSGLRVACDGLIVAASLFIVSWSLVLQTVYFAGGENTFAFAVALAYPVSDLVLVALALLLLARLAGARLPMALLAAGLIAMGVADSGFAYLSTSDEYHTGSVTDVGWVTAFLLCALAAVVDSKASSRREGTAVISRLGLFLPLAPFVLAISALAVRGWQGELDRPLVASGVALMLLMVLRQMLVLDENSHLLGTVRQREEQLRYQAFHDPLTGLANRLLFRDRLEHAAALGEREGRDLTVIFLDLDGFKVVNDRLGHAAGDALLVDVAERLRATLRRGDTVARLGGDEFAVLLEDDVEDAEVLATRVVNAMDVPFQLGRHRVDVTCSAGLATVPAVGTPAAISDRLLGSADVAMYAAKRGSKGSYVVFREGMRMHSDAPAKVLR